MKDPEPVVKELIKAVGRIERLEQAIRTIHDNLVRQPPNEFVKMCIINQCRAVVPNLDPEGDSCAS